MQGKWFDSFQALGTEVAFGLVISRETVKHRVKDSWTGFLFEKGKIALDGWRHIAYSCIGSSHTFSICQECEKDVISFCLRGMEKSR